jgi:acetylornithine/N-succinyldiaminopimelate aminotransferase
MSEQRSTPSADGTTTDRNGADGATTDGAGPGTTGDRSLTQRYADAMIPVFGAPQRVLVRGEGPYVWDEDGTRYLDLLGGIAVNALGHAHPAIVSALTKQAGSLAHVSNFFATAPQVELAEKLLEISHAPAGSGVFFANSGTEANEAAFKIARRTGRPRILALENAFHGRTMGALALTHKQAYREPFEPLPGGVDWVPVGDIDALETELRKGDVAALFVEPIQGEAGVVPVPAEYLRAARRLTREHGTLLIVDEVQTGIGRTGYWFAHQSPDIVGVEAAGPDAVEPFLPDVMTLAKGLGGGFPIGAVVTFGSGPTGLLHAGQHGTTFGGNPLGAAVALAVLGTITEDDLLGHVREVGAQAARELRAADPHVVSVTGAGLLIGIHLDAPIAPDLAAAALEAGFIVNPPNPTTIRLAPSLVVTDEQLHSFISALPGLIARVAAPDTPEGN